MEPVSLIVTSLALGAAAGLKPTSEQVIKDAYAALKSLVQRKYAKVSVEQLEEAPKSKSRRAIVEEDLTQAGADKDEEVLRQAKTLLDAIQAHAPETASAIGVDLAEIKAASLNIEDIVAQATGVRVRQGEFIGDITIGNARVGNAEARGEITDAELRAALERVARQEGSASDLELLRQALARGEITTATGEGAVWIGSDTRDVAIFTGRGDLIKIFEGDLFPFNLSLLHPVKLSKRLSSPFVGLIYPPEKSREANVWITKERRKWLGHRQHLQEHVGDAELPTDLAVNIRISSPAIDFSDEATMVLLEDQLNSLHFNGQPNDTCAPGIHAARLLITNKATGQVYKSMSFPVTVVDFAFDHVSSPGLSKLTSLVLGMGSAATFALTFLGQIDQAFGWASGGAAVAVAGFIHLQYLRLFKLPRTSVVD